MAVLVLLTVTTASREAFDQLDARVGQSMMESGGPPPGLMSHVVYPEQDGFVLADVWRSETDARAFVDDALRPLFADLDMTFSEPDIRPVWSFARP